MRKAILVLLVSASLLTAGCQRDFAEPCESMPVTRDEVTISVSVLSYELPGRSPSRCQVEIFNGDMFGQPIRVRQFSRGTHGAIIDLAIVRVMPEESVVIEPASRSQCQAHYHIMSDDGGLLEYVPASEFELQATIRDCE